MPPPRGRGITNKNDDDDDSDDELAPTGAAGVFMRDFDAEYIIELN